MCIVWNLLRRVQLQTSVWIPMSHNCMRFGKSVMNTFHPPLSMRGCRWFFNQGTVSKFLEYTLLNICLSDVILATPVNGFILVFQAFLWVKNWFKDFPFDLKEIQCFHCSSFIDCSYTCNKVSNVPNFFDCHSMFILGNG